jgi:hypothetical protein
VDYFSELATNLELSEFGSRLTVVDGRTGTPFFTDASLALDVERNFTAALYGARKFLAFYRLPLIFFFTNLPRSVDCFSSSCFSINCVN